MFKDFLNEKLTGEVINSATGLKAMPKSQAHSTVGGYVEFGYGQVEPNQLSAQRTGQIYAQLPAAADINILEQGQFVKYDYAANDNGIGQVDFTGAGEWMLVYNEIKLYRTHIDGTKQWDCEFAMIKDDYQARIYSPYDYEQPEMEYHNGLNLNGNPDHMTVDTYASVDVEGKTVTLDGTRYTLESHDFAENADGTTDKTEHTGTAFKYGEVYYEVKDGQSLVKVPVSYHLDDVTLDTEDPYELNFTNDPWKKLGIYREKKMPANMTMVPRVFKTNVGDIFTTNMVKETSLAVGDILAPGASDGILSKSGDTASMKWQVVKVYTMPDNQKGVKVMRIA